MVVGDELEELEKPTRVSASKSATTATTATSAFVDIITPLEEKRFPVDSLFLMIIPDTFPLT